MRRAPIHGNVAYYVGAPVTRRSMMSSLRPSTADQCMDLGDSYDAATGLCCSPFAVEEDAGPALPFDLSVWVPPFRLEVDR
jgi:hypothetical protein